MGRVILFVPIAYKSQMLQEYKREQDGRFRVMSARFALKRIVCRPTGQTDGE